MPELPTPDDADLIARTAHAGQVDKLGVPYIEHPRAVAESVKALGDNAVMAALLHDVIEDSDLELDDLRAAGYPAEVVSAIDAVSKRPGEPYMDMIRRALADPLGRTIKLADMAHNMSRNHLLPDDDAAWLRRKYQPAWPLLVEGGPWWAMANDVIGGWCVMPAPLPPSSGIPEAADFTSEAAARRIADLHNRDLGLTDPLAGWKPCETPGCPLAGLGDFEQGNLVEWAKTGVMHGVHHFEIGDEWWTRTQPADRAAPQ